jgi:PAS domain S-box-containing protein
MILLDLMYNFGLLTSLSVIAGFIAERWKKNALAAGLQGFLFGTIAVIGMLRPLTLGPGLNFDGRSVILSLCGLFFGPVPVAIACAMTVSLRIYQGGTGALMGVLVILSSSMIGLAGYYKFARNKTEISGWYLLPFGLAVHLVMDALMFTLPAAVAGVVFKKLALPVITIYPFATVLIGKILSDNRARARYVEKLVESEYRLQSYIDNSPDGVFVTDENGRYLEVNSSAEKITGYTRGELLSRAITDLLPPESAEASLEHFSRLKGAGKAGGEFLFLHKDGTKRWWSVDAVKLDERRFLGFGKDITARRQTEEKIAALLSEKDLLLREVHHRIKNNMTSIKGLLSLQIAREKNSSAMASLKDAESRVQSMITLYNKLYCTDNYRELSVKGYLQPLALQIVGNYPKKNCVHLETYIDDCILNVRFLSPLGIIVNELLTNMMKYAFDGRESGLITLIVSVKEAHVLIKLQDDGIGIPVSVDFGESTGFGMQIVGMLTEQLGGSIRIERNRGSLFILEFDI